VEAGFSRDARSNSGIDQLASIQAMPLECRLIQRGAPT
jgi:hypothetical protein